MKYYLGIDQGTTGTTAIIFNQEWNICGRGYSEHKQYYPEPGWVEHDPLEIWTKTKESVAAALNQAKIKAKDLRAIGLDNQGETCMVWDKNSSQPIYNAIVWQDRRTAKSARDGLKIIKSADETEAMAKSVSDSGGVYFVPAFTGLAAPYWDQYARGMMIGITGGTTREHIVRATLEAIAFQVAENLEVMRKDSAMSIDRMRADGGAVVNEFLMQFQADILGIPVDVPVINETTALGVAYLAALGVGDFNSVEAINSNWKLNKRYMPSIGEDKKKSMMEQWKKAVERSTNWIDSK